MAELHNQSGRLERMQNLISEIENRLNLKIASSYSPPQGMDSEVFIIRALQLREYVVKFGKDVYADVLAIELINSQNGSHAAIKIPVPEICTEFEFEGRHVIVMEKLGGQLLQDIPDSGKHRYLRSMVATLRKIHEIKAPRAGLVYQKWTPRADNWQELLQLILSGEHPWYPWDKILNIPIISKGIVGASLSKLREMLASKVSSNNSFPGSNYSLLHTDFNQRNIFVNPETSEVSGVIDWTEAMFGDPLYDFARLKLYKYHFQVTADFESLLQAELKLTTEESQLLDLYFMIIVLSYLRWYSDEPSGSNLARIALHQKILTEELHLKT